MGDRERPSLAVRGEVPDAAHPPTGCRFHPRCPLAEPICTDTAPALLPFGSSGSTLVGCHVVGREQRSASELLG